MLSTFFHDQTTIIEHNDGIVDKYIGDGIMAIWNHPYGKVAEHEYMACKVALLLQENSKAISDSWIARGLPRFNIRIGINSGQCLIGNIGSETRYNYTALGDTVNVASRLENLNKEFNTNILISAATFATAKQHFLCYFVGLVALRGKTTLNEVYLLGSKVQSASLQQLSLFNSLLRIRDAMLDGKYTEAWKICSNIEITDDAPVHVLLNHIQSLVQHEHDCTTQPSVI